MTNVILYGNALEIHNSHTNNKSDIESTHDTLIRVIAGRPIRQFKMSLIDQSDSASLFTDVRILKNSKRLAIFQNGSPVFDANLNDLETPSFERLAARRYRVMLNDGLFWCLIFGL